MKISNKISCNKMPITPFTIIGFYINQLEVLKIINNAVHNGKKINVKSRLGGWYYKLVYPEGIEIWIGVNSSERVENVLPFFKGENINTLQITKPIDDPKSPYKGAFTAWAYSCSGQSKDDFENDCPSIVFDTPDYLMHAGGKFPKTVNIFLTAFASHINVFKNKREFILHKDTDLMFSTKSYVSGGLNTISKDGDEQPEAYAVFTGTVKKAQLIENTETLMNFYWISVETLQVSIDVVADKRMLKSTPKPGSIVRVSAWIVGDWIEHQGTCQ